MSISRQPSTYEDYPWIVAKRQVGNYPAHTEQGGKWLLFVPVAQIDEIWQKIANAVEQGLLGGLAKVATAFPNPHQRDPNKRMISVYTYDCTDEEDVRRVRQQLRDLGFTGKIAYKADQATREGQYSQKGQRVSKYYE